MLDMGGKLKALSHIDKSYLKLSMIIVQDLVVIHLQL